MILDILKTGISIVKNVITDNGEKGILESAANIIRNKQDDPAVKQAMLDQELEMKKLVLKDAEGARALITAESKSEDAFVRRARPAFMWLFYGVIIFNFILLPLIAAIGKFSNPDFSISFDYPVLPEQLYYLFGASFLGYSGLRSWDKKKCEKK